MVDTYGNDNFTQLFLCRPHPSKGSGAVAHIELYGRKPILNVTKCMTKVFGWIAVTLSLTYKFPQIYKLQVVHICPFQVASPCSFQFASLTLHFPSSLLPVFGS